MSAGGAGSGDGLRLERLLPFACAAAAATLFGSEFLPIFEFTPQGIDPQVERSAADQHSFAQGLLAAFALVAMVVAVWGGSKPAATAVAIAGVVSLLIFLLLDLPDAGQIGTLDDPRQTFVEAEAVPQAGFWLELVGALGLALTGAALATLSPEQLAALRPRLKPGPRRRVPRRRGATQDGDGPERGRDLIEAAEGYGEEVRDGPKENTGKSSRRTAAKTKPD